MMINPTATAIILAAATALAQTPTPTGTVGPGVVQDKSVKPKAQPEVSLDIVALLHDERVLAAQAQDMVWTITAGPGRRLMQVPVIVKPIDQTSMLANPPLGIRGGRFICWRIVEDDQEETKPDRRRDRTGLRVGDSRFTERMLLTGPTYDLGGPVRPGQSQTDPNVIDRAAGAIEEALKGIAEDAPRFARRLWIEPNGTVRWKLDRGIPGGEITTQAKEGYALKLNPRLLIELEPQKPTRITRGADEDAREYRAKRLAQDMEYRAKIEEYRQLTRTVRELPDEFQLDLPSRLWAVFEVSQAFGELNMSGPPPLPWRIGLEDFQMLRQTAAKRSGGGDQFDYESYRMIAQLSGMARSQHPLTLRLVAMALDWANMVGQANSGDSLYRLLKMIINSDDAQARNIVIRSLATTIPPTAATARLLGEAARYMDPTQKLLALRGMIQVDLSQPAGLGQMLRAANEALADAQGPDVGAVLAGVVEQAGNRPEIMAQLTTGIDFQKLTPARADQVIAYTIRAAGTEPLAASWLNHRLLGSADGRVVGRSLELIDAAGGESRYVTAIASTLLNLVLGPPVNAPSDTVTLDLKLSALIPIDSSNHNIYRCLSSGDPQLNELAWSALRNFRIDDVKRAGGRTGGITGGDEPDLYRLILDAAFSKEYTPRSLPVFLAKQSDQQRAGEALIRVVIQADPPTAAAGARKLRGCGWPIDSMVANLDAEQRELFGRRVYESLAGEVPLVVGLLRQTDGRGNIVRWFAGQLAQGNLPEPIEWAMNYNREEDLLELAGSTDPALAAGAVAALVSLAGGDELAAASLVEDFSQLPDRTIAGLKALWRPAKKQIYTSRLASSAGSYRLMVIVAPPPPTPAGKRPRTPRVQPYPGTPGTPGPGGMMMPPGMMGPNGPYGSAGPPPLTTTPTGQPDAEQPQAAQTEKINLGVIDLIVEQQAVRFEGDVVDLVVPEEHLAIRIKRVGDLKNFENPQLDKLPLSRISQPMDLMPQPDGSWRGQASLPDDRTIELLMEPVQTP